MPSLRKLKGLGPKSEKQLNLIGVYSKEDLVNVGPIRAYIRLKNEDQVKISLNFLYAMVGAIEDTDWRQIAKEEKGRLLMELEGYEELKQLLNKDGISI